VAYSLKIEGLENALNKFGKYPRAFKAEVNEEFRQAANDFAKLAKSAAPGDQGFLRKDISSYKEKDLNWVAVSAADYSAYMEWGTKKYTNVPPHLQAYASQFKKNIGKGGGFDALFLKILDWVGRKGIAGRYSVKSKRRLGNKFTRISEDADVAMSITLKILREGVKPQPFFFEQLEKVKPQLMRNLNQIAGSI
jgi:hypothetical protein